jgi:hypothetical protein
MRMKTWRAFPVEAGVFAVADFFFLGLEAMVSPPGAGD